MKKFLLFFLFASMIFVALPTETKAQTASTFKFLRTATNSVSRFYDTHADTVTLYLPGYYKTVGFQPVVTKDSGTVTGTVIIAGSIDGIHFKDIDTLTLTNVSAQHDIYKHSDPVWVYYRGIALGSGTMAAKLQIYYTARKEP